MLPRSQIQYIRSLHLKKFRDKHREFIVEGPKLVEELVQSKFSVSRIFAAGEYFNKWNDRNIKGAKLEIVSPSELGRISTLKTPNGMLAVAGMSRLSLQDLKVKDEFVLLLDGISDPGNLGTIIRTADWFGIRAIVCTSDTVEVYNPKVVQATMGSVFRSKVVYGDAIKFLSGLDHAIPVYGTFLDGSNIFRESFGNEGVVVIGSESHGIRPGIEPFIGRRLHIPSAGSKAESLNASVATAIVCSGIRRKQLMNI